MSVASALRLQTTDDDLLALAREFEGASPQAVLGWALEEFGHDVALATGFGAEGCVLVDMVARIDRQARIFYLDTDLLFPETEELRYQLAARYGVCFERRATPRSLEQQALRHGERLWERE